MPTMRELLLVVRNNRPAYDAWRAAIEYLGHGVSGWPAERVVNEDLVHPAIERELGETPMLLYTSRAATLAVLYLLGYGKNRDIVAPKMVEMRLAP